MTNPFGQSVSALLALVTMWSLVRAFRRGVIFDENWVFDLNEDPMLFTLVAIFHGFAAAFFAFIAAGYDQATFWYWVVGR